MIVECRSARSSSSCLVVVPGPAVPERVPAPHGVGSPRNLHVATLLAGLALHVVGTRGQGGRAHGTTCPDQPAAPSTLVPWSSSKRRRKKNKNKITMIITNPTELFAIDKFSLVQKRRLTDFEAVKFWNVRLGSCVSRCLIRTYARHRCSPPSSSRSGRMGSPQASCSCCSRLEKQNRVCAMKRAKDTHITIRRNKLVNKSMTIKYTECRKDGT